MSANSAQRDTHFHQSGEGAVSVGRRTTVGSGVRVVFARPGRVSIGDYCVVADGAKIVCNGGDVSIGDWTTLHDHCLLLSGKGLVIGEHCWFGQYCVIDGTGGMYIGNGVRVGMYSQLWSHVAAGERIEGCTLFAEREVRIDDDVWLVGSCIVASGVTIGRRAVALIGSNITKSVPAGSVVAGAPAATKESLSFYRPVSLQEKWEMLKAWLPEIAGCHAEEFLFRGEACVRCTWADARSSDAVVFARTRELAQAIRNEGRGDVCVCCIEDKSYNKTLGDLEFYVLKYLAGNKARFRDAERVSA